MIFYRYQGQNTLETGSIHNDIVQLYDDYFNNDVYRNSFENNKTFIKHLYSMYKSSLSLRDNIDSFSLFQTVLNTKSYQEAEDLMLSSPLAGIFGMDAKIIDSQYTLKDLLEHAPWWSMEQNFLLLYKGEKISDSIGYENGEVLFKPHCILNIWKL